MRPQWFGEDEIPFDKMWPDDIHWFPYMLRGAHFYEYVFFEKMDKIINYTLEEVASMDSITMPQKALNYKSV